MATVAFLLLSVAYLAMSLARMKSLASRLWMQPKHSIISGIAWLLIGLLSNPVLITGYAYGARNLPGRYTSISPKGLNLMETVLEKDGRKVHLVGMMHIGDGACYRDLKDRLNATSASGGMRLVLTEGVSDRSRIIPEDFANGKTHERWETLLGLESRKSLESTAADGPSKASAEPKFDRNPEIIWQNADIDISDLKEHHRNLLVEFLTLASSADLAHMLTAGSANVSGEHIEDLVMNDTLMERFNEAGAEFQGIYIPWGAAHLPDIEKRLLDLG